LLIGAGATAAAGVGAAVEAGAGRRQRLLHRIGLAPSPDRPPAPSRAQIVDGQLDSHHMGRSVGWALSLPATAAEGVIYCLHGRGGDHRFAFDQIHLQDVTAPSPVPMAVAAVDGGSDSYWHRRADGTDAMAMLLEEFIPLIERRAATAKRALLGWSMGGYGGLLAAERVPERFRAVAAASPALWTSPGATAAGAFDGAADYHRFDVFADTARLAALVVRVDCGRGDPFFQADSQFVARLPPGHQGSFGPGFHDVAYWRSIAGAQVATIAAAFRAV
jgi:S-formylglutathione hydrolase FrmB